jgi:Tfp pilus assembly protein PilF
MTMSALFRFALIILGALTLAPFASAQQPAATNAAPAPAGITPNSTLTSPGMGAGQKIADAMRRMSATPPDIDGAMTDLNQAIQLEPNDGFAYGLRGSLYVQKKQFPEAEADFATALKLEPNNAVMKFNVAEVKFMQKQYDDARAGFAALQKDPDLGDFAMYKVFLCDLFGGHEDLAKSELAAINKKGDDASYYFANASWDLYHKNTEDARTWLVSASHIYTPKKFTTYGESLRYLGYLPIPEPKGDASNP